MNEMSRHSFFNQFNYTDQHDHMNKTSGHDGKNVNARIGICYVPVQEWEQPYDEDTGFSAGTIFPSLNKPFYGGGR